MISCKKCNNKECVKNGTIRNNQRYKCKKCGLNFIDGDKRTKEITAIKKALAYSLYSLGKASFRFIAKLFNCNVSVVYMWIKRYGKKLPDPEIKSDIKEVEIDEMWHFIGKKKTKNGLSKPWIEIQSALLPGLQVIVTSKQSRNFIKK